MEARLRQIKPLSADATRVLAVLRSRGCDSPSAALTDEHIAAAAGMPHRNVIDARGELIEHNFLVLTDGHGHYLLPDNHSLDPAYRMRRSLRRRAVAILRRERALSGAIRCREQIQRPPAPRGAQLGLYASSPVPRSKELRT